MGVKFFLFTVFLILLTLWLSVVSAQTTSKEPSKTDQEIEKSEHGQSIDGGSVDTKNRPLIAVITGLTGGVFFQREQSENWEKAMLNLPLYEGDRVKTEAGSQATLWRRNGGAIVLKPKEIVRVTKKNSQKREDFFETLWNLLIHKIGQGESPSVQTRTNHLISRHKPHNPDECVCRKARVSGRNQRLPG